MLKVEGLNAGYGSVNILWDIGFEVKDGEIVAILGSNGAGKTTMVRTITGMVKASSGKVEFNGEDLSGKSSRVILDSGIVQVPEGRQLFTEMTVLENLELGAFNKETKAHFAENLEKCYNWFPKLRERAKQAAGTLSGGEQQMVAVARALIGMPKLLILDEPSLGLAPNIVDDILEVAKTMVKNDGISVLLVEQDITKALAAADRGYVIENGRVAQKNYLCHSLHIPPQVFIMRYIARFFGINSVCFSRISTLFSITFQQNGVVMVYQTVLYQPDIFRSCRSDDPGKATSFAICSAAWS